MSIRKTDYELAKELIHLSSRALHDSEDLDRCLQKEIHEISTTITGLNKSAAPGGSDTNQQIDARINLLIRKLHQDRYPIEKMGREIELVRERLADIVENKSAANYSPERELLMTKLLESLEGHPYSLERQVLALEGMLRKGGTTRDAVIQSIDVWNKRRHQVAFEQEGAGVGSLT